jgi:hypothetical protein
MIKFTNGDDAAIWIVKSAIEAISPNTSITAKWAKAIIQVGGVTHGVAETVSKAKEMYDAA